MLVLSVNILKRVLKPQAESLLFAAVLLLLQPVQTEVVDPVFQIVGLRRLKIVSFKTWSHRMPLNFVLNWFVL